MQIMPPRSKETSPNVSLIDSEFKKTYQIEAPRQSGEILRLNDDHH